MVALCVRFTCELTSDLIISPAAVFRPGLNIDFIKDNSPNLNQKHPRRPLVESGSVGYPSSMVVMEEVTNFVTSHRA